MLLCTCLFASTLVVIINPTPQVSSNGTSSNPYGPQSGDSLSPTLSLNAKLANFSLLRGKRNIFNSTKNSPLLYLCCLVVAQSGDTHPNPGPRAPRFPCGSCNKAVQNCHAAILCDDCDTWYHKSCIGMSSEVYSKLACQTHNFSWICCTCGLPNFSSSLFDLDTSRISTSNPYSTLDTTQRSDIGSPIAASSPKPSKTHRLSQSNRRPLKSLVVNCQSLRSKNRQAELHSVLESVKPDVVFGTESWLDNSILSSEVFPENFTVYRKDRANDPHGGVFLLVDSSLISSEEPSLDIESSELVWAKICSAGSKDLLLCSFYRPPSGNSECLENLNSSLSLTI